MYGVYQSKYLGDVPNTVASLLLLFHKYIQSWCSSNGFFSVDFPTWFQPQKPTHYKHAYTYWNTCAFSFFFLKHQIDHSFLITSFSLSSSWTFPPQTDQKNTEKNKTKKDNLNKVQYMEDTGGGRSRQDSANNTEYEGLSP